MIPMTAARAERLEARQNQQFVDQLVRVSNEVHARTLATPHYIDVTELVARLTCERDYEWMVE